MRTSLLLLNSLVLSKISWAFSSIVFVLWAIVTLGHLEFMIFSIAFLITVYECLQFFIVRVADKTCIVRILASSAEDASK